MCSHKGYTKGLHRYKGNREMVLAPCYLLGTFLEKVYTGEKGLGLVGEGSRGAPIVV